MTITINMSNEKEYDKSHLTELQFKVTQENGTEKPFDNEYWNNKEKGIYVDIVSGEVLFSSNDKYDSGSGWPSFTKSISKDSIIENKDNSLPFEERIEIKSKKSKSHLGHVFTDGPKDRGGLRFCVNSAALKFIALKDMKSAGYGDYVYLFEENDNSYKKAYLAGGCFWGMEHLFAEKLPGIKDVVNGYTGGSVDNPTYELVKTGTTGHAEVIEITYDSKLVSYEELLKFFFKIHDPTTQNRQQGDIGSQYRSEIFYNTKEEQNIANTIIQEGDKSGVYDAKIITKVTKFDKFWKAEDYHQDYLKKNPNGYICHIVRDNWSF